MAKTVMITIEGTIPDGEMGKNATLTIESATYKGTVSAIITYEDTPPPVPPPAPTTVTLEALGLKVTG